MPKSNYARRIVKTAAVKAQIAPQVCNNIIFTYQPKWHESKIISHKHFTKLILGF